MIHIEKKQINTYSNRKRIEGETFLVTSKDNNGTYAEIELTFDVGVDSSWQYANMMNTNISFINPDTKKYLSRKITLMDIFYHENYDSLKGLFHDEFTADLCIANCNYSQSIYNNYKSFVEELMSSEEVLKNIDRLSFKIDGL